LNIHHYILCFWMINHHEPRPKYRHWNFHYLVSWSMWQWIYIYISLFYAVGHALSPSLKGRKDGQLAWNCHRASVSVQLADPCSSLSITGQPPRPWTRPVPVPLLSLYLRIFNTANSSRNNYLLRNSYTLAMEDSRHHKGKGNNNNNNNNNNN
jgi:hypothetical protein